jgi:hypothetical protein
MDCTGASGIYGNIYGGNAYHEIAHGFLLRARGAMFLVHQDEDPATGLLNYLLRCPDDMVPSVVEAMSVVCNDQSICSRMSNWDSPKFDGMVGIILREHRISYELVNSEMIEFSSKELHQEILVPALRLLASLPQWANVESAYQAALSEISKGEPSNAITDAGTALQEALTLLGCSGNSLGPLAKSARDMGLLAAHDSQMTDAVVKIIHWASADRSELGDAHVVSPATVDDAWFTVHIVGSLILRLSKASQRPRKLLNSHQIRSPGLSLAWALWARAIPRCSVYSRTMSYVFQPAMCIRSSGLPPLASQPSANERRKRCGCTF